MARVPRDYDDISGSYVFDAERARQGYALNMFCKTLDDEANRECFRADEDAYLARLDLTEGQRRAVRDRDWIAMLEQGGNIYFLFKLAIFDRTSMQAVGAKMSGMTEDEFRQMMIDGGRRIDG